jgi:hypothetical protein
MTMNPTPDHLDDDVLSALLDGDTGAATGGDGTGADAAAHLRACDRCAGRQAELAGARSALAAAPVEPVDELTRRRLVAAALAAAEERAPGAAARDTAAAVPIGRARWARRHQALIGSAAAVVLALLVGVPFVLDDGGPGGGETLTALAPEQDAAGTYLGDLGELSDRSNLRLRLSGVASDSYATPPAEAGPSPALGYSTPAPMSGAPGSGGLADASGRALSTTTISPQAPAAGSRNSGRPAGGDTAEKSAAEPEADDAATAPDQGFSSDQPALDRADTDRCVAVLLNGPARGGKLVRSGTGTYQGRPAIVASFELSGGTEAFITDRAGCEVLDRFSV